VVAISPIVGGAPVKGPADKLLRGIGAEVSARGVAALYRDFATASCSTPRRRARRRRRGAGAARARRRHADARARRGGAGGGRRAGARRRARRAERRPETPPDDRRGGAGEGAGGGQVAAGAALGRAGDIEALALAMLEDVVAALRTCPPSTRWPS
jgi:hypothetical protein